MFDQSSDHLLLPPGEPLSIRGLSRLTLTRRQLLAGLGLTVIGVACSKSSEPPAPSGPAGSIRSVIVGASQVSVLGTGADAPPMNPGKNRLGVVLVTAANKVIRRGYGEHLGGQRHDRQSGGPRLRPLGTGPPPRRTSTDAKVTPLSDLGRVERRGESRSVSKCRRPHEPAAEARR